MKSAPGFAFASRIAWRSEPSPLSSRFVTVKVAALTRFVTVVNAMAINASSAIDETNTAALLVVRWIIPCLLRLTVQDNLIVEIQLWRGVPVYSIGSMDVNCSDNPKLH